MRTVEITSTMGLALLLAATVTGCVPQQNAAESTPQPMVWERQEGDDAPRGYDDSVEWVDAEAGTFLLTYRGGALKDEELAEVRLGATGADFLIDPSSQGGPDLGEMKTYLTRLPAHFDRDVPVRVSVDGRPKGVLPPADG